MSDPYRYKPRRPYVRWNRNRFGDSQIVIACGCGAGSSGTPDEPLQPPHASSCPLAKVAS